ncbi:MAG: NUDIX hydrolase [Halapricum sp.]
MDLERNYCPTCGTELTEREIEGRTRRFCPSCERPIYRNPKPAAGVVVFRDDAVLLVERTNPPAIGHWSLPAGYLEVDEPPRQAAVRELREETGLRVGPTALSLVATQFVEPEARESVLVIVYAAPASMTEGEVRAGSDAAAAQFWERSAFSSIPIEPGYESVFKRVLTSQDS